MRQAFCEHMKVISQTANRLTLFYAAECGLKAVCMRRLRLRTTAQLQPQLKAQGHDLMFWARQLRLPASITKGVITIRVRNEQVARDLSVAHQAWRYGVKVNGEDEPVLIVWLKDVCDWAIQELRQ